MRIHLTCLLFLYVISIGVGQNIGIYNRTEILEEKARMEQRSSEMYQVLLRFMQEDMQRAFKNTRIQYPLISEDGSLLNFFANNYTNTIILPLHSLLLMEDLCTAYAWLHQNNFNLETINEYASLLHYQYASGGRDLQTNPLFALGIPANALENPVVDDLSLRLRNSAFAFIIAHEMGHIYYRHKGNTNVSPSISRADERSADEFAIGLLAKDKEVPMGAILFFQVTAFISAPSRFDYKTRDEWERAIKTTTHPLTSERVRNLSKFMDGNASIYHENEAIALDVAKKLRIIATEMDDLDWHLYFKKIGQGSSISDIKPRPR